MIEIDTAEIRKVWNTPLNINMGGRTVIALCDEVDRLRANEKQLIITCNEKLRLANDMMDDLRAQLATARAAAMEDAAKIVEGEAYKTVYRRWPALTTWVGDLHRESQAARMCAALAAAIRAIASSGGEKGNRG